MKQLISIFLFTFFSINNCLSQETVITISAKMFDERQLVPLAPLDGWIFKVGNDPSWANEEVQTTDWVKFKPTEISSQLANKSGRAEGWFRLRFKLDKELIAMPLGIQRGSWAATDIFLDGVLVASFGSVGTSEENFQEYNPIDKSSIPIKLTDGAEHLLAVHFVDYVSPIPPYRLRSETIGGVRFETLGLQSFIMIAGPKHDLIASNFSVLTLPYRSIWLSVTCLLALLFWLLAFLNPQERKIILLIATYSSFAALSNLMRFFLTDTGISFIAHRLSNIVLNLSHWALLISSITIIFAILKIKIPTYLKRLFITYAAMGTITIMFDFFYSFMVVNVLIAFLLTSSLLFTSWRKLKGAQWAIAGGIATSILFGAMQSILNLINTSAGLLLYTCFYFSFPLSLVVYVSMRFREIIKEVEDNARHIVRLTKESEERAVRQQKMLEEEVARQTIELRTSLEHLKSAQSQLIQSEKMTSLGELTAGIAHEIQNPLNFVNNFSEVNTELIEELKAESGKPKAEWDESLIKATLDNLKDNEQKIVHHGKRADAIVKGMLQHSRASSGQKEPTDINALCDEYLRLSYHGYRAKDKSFNAKIETDFDSSLPKLNVVPQDIGRVVLNLINNAFYTTNEKRTTNNESYHPTVTISTKNRGDKILISIKDNGNGIPESIKEKIFQPFFTTKPTGQGTGLGLSLAYDIVTKGHGGEFQVTTQERSGSEFIITLPT